MKISIELSKYNYICNYATIGSIENGIDINLEDDFDVRNIKDYQYINGELFYNPIPKEKPEGLNLIYNGNKWEEQATPEERQAHWREEIIKVKSRIRTENDIFGGASKELTDKLNKYIKLHEEVSQEIVNAMPNFNG